MFVMENLVTVLWYSGVQILILLVSIQRISPELYEAASIDGASGWEKFWKITLPLLSVLERLPESRRNELVERLSRCYEDDSAVEYLRSTVEAEGGLTYAGEVMQDYIARAAAMLSDYGDSEYRSALVNLCAYIAERDR